MAKQSIGIGTNPNDGTGDTLRDAFDKVNDNFTELYSKPDISLASDVITITRADGTTDTVNIAAYMDEDSRSIASGTLNGATGVVTFTRDDATTFTLDLSDLLDDTDTTYTTSAVDSGDDAIIRLTGSDSTTEDIKLVAGSNITITPSGDDITIAATAASGDITAVNTNLDSGLSGGVTTGAATISVDLDNLGSDTVDVAADSFAFIDATNSDGTRKDTIADLVSAMAGTGLSASSGVLSVSATDNNTTYTISAADGANSDEEKIVITGSDSSTDEVVLEAGTGLSIARSGDKITFTNTVSDTDTVRTVTAGGNTLADSETLAFTAGTAVDISESAGAVTIGVDVSDFMTNGSNNRVLTATGTDAMNAEANLTFDGSTLDIEGIIDVTKDNSTNGGRTSPVDVMKLTATYSGTDGQPFAGFGGGIDFFNETYSNGVENSAAIYGIIGDDSTSTDGGSLAFHTSTTVTGTPSERMRLTHDGRLGIGTNSPAQALHVAGDIGVDANIIHNGDTNTYINFGSDSMNFYAGNQKMITLSEGVTDEVVINQGSADIDFRVESNNKEKAIFVNGETDHVQASVGVQSNPGTGNMTLDAEKYGVFKLTGNITTSTLTINNMQEGQVIDIILSGTLTSAAITLSSDGTGRTFNNVGGGTLDTSATNHIQVVCIDDTAASKIFNYSIATYSSDNQP